MAYTLLSEAPPLKLRVRKENRVLADQDFPSEEPPEEKVAETIRHLEARTTLFLVTRTARENISVGSDQFVYFDRTNPKKRLAPDVFVKLDSNLHDFDTWLIWRDGVPDLAVEIVSFHERMKLPWKEKFARYEAVGVQELVRFDPWKLDTMQVWDRIDGKLVQRATDGVGTYECKTLGLYWTVEMTAEFGDQLRLCRDPEGKELLPTPSEIARQLEKKLGRARRSRARERHKRMLAEQKQHEESAARLQAEEQRQHAEEQRQHAEEQRQHAEERLRSAESELHRLRSEMQRLQHSG